MQHHTPTLLSSQWLRSAGLRAISCAALTLAFLATASATTYYLSPAGSDSNNGTSSSAPWKTIAKVNAATFHGGDTLLLQGGQSFTGSINFKRSLVLSSTASHFTVGSYGTGNATVISTGTGADSYAICLQGVSGIVLQDLIVRPGTTSPQAGIYIRSDSSTPAPQDITVQRCDVGGFHYAPANFGGEIFANGYWGSLTSVKILNNVLHGLSGPSSPDDNGFASLGNGKNILNLAVQGNVVYDIGATANALAGSIGNGILANGVDGGVLQYNVVHDCGGNTTTCGGPGAIWAYSSNNVTIQFNEVYAMRPVSYTAGCDWSAYDLDGSTTNCVVQYNYSHDNFGPALLAYVNGTWGPNVFRYNISENDDYGNSDGGPITLAGTKVSGTVQIYNNTIYDGSNQISGNGHSPVYGPYTTGTWGAGSMIKNNLFYVTNKNQYGNVDLLYFPYQPQANLAFDNNVYYVTAATARWRWGGTIYTSFASYQAGTGFDANSLTTNPQLVAPATGGTLSWTPALPDGPQPNPSGYALRSAAPILGLGANLGTISSGTRDYFGNAIPNGVGSGYSIGAAAGGAGSSADIIVDNSDATGVTTTGTWIASTATTGYYGTNYLQDGNANKGKIAIQWTPTLSSGGTYTVYAMWTSDTNRCASVPYQVVSSSGTTTVNVNQQLNGGTWVSLGTYTFASGTSGCVKVSNAGTSGYVIADAVRFQQLILTSIAVTPATASVVSGSNQQFSAVGLDQFGTTLAQQPAVTWSASGGGAISSSGLFTTGTSAGGPYSITASSGTVTGTSTVSVIPGALSAITVAPANGSVQAGATQQYSALAVDSYGNALSPQPAFSWTVSDGGTIDENGLFTAGATAGGPFAVTATSGAVSGTASTSVVIVPEAPTNLSATWASMLNGYYTLAWTDNSSNESGFAIQSLSGTTWTTAATVAANATSYTKSGLNMPSGPYTLRVIATGSSGFNSAASNQVTFSIPTPPTMPDPVVATPGSSGVTLSWPSVAGASNYNISRSATSGTSGFSVIKFNQSGTSYLDSSVVQGTTYWYKVCYNVSGVGASLFGVAVSVTAPTPVFTSIAVSPATASVQSGSSQQFSAVAKDQFGGNLAQQPAFNWSVSGGGNISAAGLFTSGTTAGGPYTVTASSGTFSGTATITVVAGALSAIAIAPLTPSVQAGASQQFSAVASDSSGNALSPQPSIAWSVTGGGSINSSGLFASGTSVGGPYTVTAASGSVSGTTSVTVVPGALSAIGITPANASIQTGTTQQYSAVGLDSFGNAVSPQPSFIWSVTGGGTISGGGLFASGTIAGGPYSVAATGGLVSGSTSVTVMSGSADIIVDNTDATGVVTTGSWTASSSTAGYYGSNYWHDGNANKGGLSIQWTPSLPYNGTYTVYARWTAGANRSASVPCQVISASGTTTVSLNQQLNGGVWVSLGSYSFTSGTNGCVKLSNAGTTGFVIADAVRFQKAAGAGDTLILSALTVSPASASLQTGATQQFSGIGKDQYGAILVPSAGLNWSVSGGGTVNSSGLFTSGTSAGGPFTVTATSGTLASTASVSITTPFDAWKTARFGADANNPAVSGASVANNPAGISNFMAYALGLDPFTATIAQMPSTGVVAVSGTKYLVLRFTRNTSATDVSYLVQGSNNLADPNGWGTVSYWSGGVWSPAANVSENGSDPVTSIEVRDLAPVPANPRRFIRLQVIH